MFVLKESDDADKNTASAKEKKHAGGKYCVFVFCGKFQPGAFVGSDKSGKTSAATADPETGVMTDEFEEQMKSEEPATPEKYGKAAEKFAKSKGWTVVKNDWISGKETMISEATNSERMKNTIKERLLAGVVHFKYKKVDKPAKFNRRTGEITPAVPGEIREAWGTLNQDLIRRTIGDVERASARARIPSESVVVYFDIHASNRDGIEGDWRCFKLDNF